MRKHLVTIGWNGPTNAMRMPLLQGLLPIFLARKLTELSGLFSAPGDFEVVMAKESPAKEIDVSVSIELSRLPGKRTPNLGTLKHLVFDEVAEHLPYGSRLHVSVGSPGIGSTGATMSVQETT